MCARRGEDWVVAKAPEDVFDTVLRVAEEHLSVVAEEKWVLNAGITGGHGSLEHDHLGGVPDAEHRHSGDRTAGVFGGRRVDSVVGADDEDDGGPVEVASTMS